MRRILPFAVLVATGCVFAVLVAAGCVSSPTTPTQPRKPDLDFPVGEFSLTERSGKTVTEKDLRGKVWIASFVFTRCNGPCPAVTSTMARLQTELKPVLMRGDVKLVTFTVDPERDDLKALKEYANNRQADPENWLFLTGDKKTIHTLVKEQFKQAVEEKSGPDAKPGDEFGHSTRLLLVDKNNVIRAAFDGLPNDEMPDGKEQFEDGLKQLKERVRELLR
jgi:cytochrome oxidase Cu insertion factor (SCO1/SenC/PrrC family)